MLRETQQTKVLRPPHWVLLQQQRYQGGGGGGDQIETPAIAHTYSHTHSLGMQLAALNLRNQYYHCPCSLHSPLGALLNKGHEQRLKGCVNKLHDLQVRTTQRSGSVLGRVSVHQMKMEMGDTQACKKEIIMGSETREEEEA